MEHSRRQWTAGAVQRFEDLVAWQKARQLTRVIYKVTADGAFSKDFGLRDQVRRASVSIMSNIAEGFERGGRAEFHQFVVIAKASCAEVRSQLYAAFDAGYLDRSDFNELMSRADEVGRILGGLRATLARPKDGAKR